MRVPLIVAGILCLALAVTANDIVIRQVVRFLIVFFISRMKSLSHDSEMTERGQLLSAI
jgi:hypothetical protein